MTMTELKSSLINTLVAMTEAFEGEPVAPACYPFLEGCKIEEITTFIRYYCDRMDISFDELELEDPSPIR